MEQWSKIDLQRLKRICEIASGIDGNVGREAQMALEELNRFMSRMEVIVACDCLGPFSVSADSMAVQGETTCELQ
jgi:hypothetical protein